MMTVINIIFVISLLALNITAILFNKKELNKFRKDKELEIDQLRHIVLSQRSKERDEHDKIISRLSTWITVKHKEIGTKETLELLSIVHDEQNLTSEVH